MIKLMIAEQDRAVQNAIVPVRWCVERETLEVLRQKGVKKPYVLIVVPSEFGEDDRWLAPLEQLVEYVQFQRSGKNYILATIVWIKEDDLPFNLDRMFLWKKSDKYKKHLVDFDYQSDDSDGGYKKINPELRSIGDRLGFTRIEVVVPEQLFAKKAPEWEQRWVNLWYESKPKDQCQYRKRRVLAYTIQPPAILLWMMLKTLFCVILAAFLLMFGMRGVSLKPLIHPFRNDAGDVWRDVKKNGSVFLPELFGLTFYPAFTAAPIIVVPVFMLAWLISHSWLIGLFAVLIVFFAACILGATGLLVAIILESLLMNKASKAEKTVKYSQLYGKEDDLLMCNGQIAPNINALPKDKKTIHLRYMNFKARWCKPFN